MARSDKDPCRRAKSVLLVSSAATLVFLAAAAIEENVTAEWRGLQREFRRALATEAAADWQRKAAGRFAIEIRQTIILELELVDRCQTCHVAADWPASPLAQPYAAHPARFLFVEPHPPERFGCTSCHQGQGRAVTREDAHGRVKHWPAPVLPRGSTSASCLKCHGDVEKLRGAEALAEGIQLFRRSGCYACHETPGFEEAPPPALGLGNAGRKLNYTWLVKWLWDPQALAPRTRMPNYGFSLQEAASVAEYLFSLARTERMNATPATIPPAAREAGRRLYEASGCETCHATAGQAPGDRPAPDLTGIGSKLRSAEWIVDWLADPRALDQNAAMPRYRFSLNQRRLLAAFLVARRAEPARQEIPALKPGPIPAGSILAGKRLVEASGCRNCHRIPDVQPDPGFAPGFSSIGARPLATLDFEWFEGERTRAAWLFKKTRTPRMFPGGPKMPHFGLSDEEAHRVSVFLLGLDGRRVPHEYRVEAANPDYEPAGEAAALFNDLQCLSCHAIKGRGAGWAPDLTYEGSAVQREWLETYLRTPTPVRPMSPGMPNFRLTAREAEILADYILATLRDPRTQAAEIEFPADAVRTGRALYTEKGCHACHRMGGSGGRLGPDLTAVGDRLTSSYLLERTKDARRFVPDIVEPRFGFSRREAYALAAYLASRKGRRQTSEEP